MILPNNPRHKWQFEAIGTQWSVETVEPLGQTKQKITERVEVFDQAYSRFRDDSLVTKISQVAGEYDFPSDAKKMGEFYRSLYVATEGAMSPLIGGALSEAGYDKDYSLKPRAIAEVPLWDSVMVWNGVHVKTNQPVLLDFGAVGKGCLIDVVAGILESDGHDKYIVDASGDIRACGVSQNVGLENPFDSSVVVGVANINNASLCASATNRRSWGEWHHVINAKTAKPVSDIVATWVVADDTMIADGIATALFFVDPDKLSQWAFEYVRMDKHGRIDKSVGFMGELFA